MVKKGRKLKDGRNVVVRSNSGGARDLLTGRVKNDGLPTLEIQNEDRTKIKIRYIKDWKTYDGRMN